MTNEEKKQVLAAYWDATIKGDVDALRAVLADDVTIWLVPSARDHGLPIPLLGRDVFLDLFRNLQHRSSMWKTHTMKPLQFLFDDEDGVAMRLRLIGKFESGFVYDNEYMFVFKVADGKVKEMREFTDTVYINKLIKQAAS